LPADEAGEFPVAVLDVLGVGDQGFKVALDALDIALLERIAPRPAGGRKQVVTHEFLFHGGL